VELSDVIASRRSIRKFRGENISTDTVRLLLDAARLAPSGSNLQPARFIIAQSPAAKEALSRYTPYKFIVKASVIFVCCADLTAMTSRDRSSYTLTVKKRCLIILNYRIEGGSDG